MERIPGYTLAEVWERGGTIVSPQWRELERLVATLNNKHHVVHRDLHLGNIMLKTNQSLPSEQKLSGELYLIDFGLSRRTMGAPTDEDYLLTIGNEVIKYTSDRSQVRVLEPVHPGTVGGGVFLY
jgi:tRNA A-37 threonylcarbamoyl transferase component Bud32